MSTRTAIALPAQTTSGSARLTRRARAPTVAWVRTSDGGPPARPCAIMAPADVT